MKKILILLFACTVCACHKSGRELQHNTDVVAVHDVTDQLLETPVTDAILQLYCFQDDINQAATFRYVLITDRNLNAVAGNAIDNGTVTEKMNTDDEVNYRERLVYSFYDGVRNTMQNFQKEFSLTHPLAHSECYCTVAGELVRLSESKASQRFIIIFSDMQENSCLFNCYTDEGQQLLVSNPRKVAKMLQRGMKLPDNLVGVTAFFVYRPPDRESDIHYARIMAIYKQLLHERGCRVVIQATAKSFEL